MRDGGPTILSRVMNNKDGFKTGYLFGTFGLIIGGQGSMDFAGGLRGSQILAKRGLIFGRGNKKGSRGTEKMGDRVLFFLVYQSQESLKWLLLVSILGCKIILCLFPKS